MQDVGAVPLRARPEDQGGQADPMLAAASQLSLRALGRGDRLRVNAEITNQRERSLRSRVISR